jgi:replication-associated recombination protein RarA
MNTSPSTYAPQSPADFIGPAAKLALMLERKSANARATGAPMKILLHGDPGMGKTALANMVARLLSAHPTQIESVNGQDVGISLVRQWHASFPYLHLGGGFRVIIVNEVDTVTPAAQDLLLSILDDLPAWWAVIGTMNLTCGSIKARFQTRFQQFGVFKPSEDEIVELLERFGLNGESRAIARACKGNVRAALLDAQSVLDCR